MRSWMRCVPTSCILLSKSLSRCLQVYHTEEGTRHKFFRVYPYIKQLRRWIKNKRREQASGRHIAAASRADAAAESAGIQSQHHQHQQQQHRSHQQNRQQVPQQAQLKAQINSGSGAQLSSLDSQAGSVAKPAPVTHCSAPVQPGQAWLNFTLDRESVLQHLTCVLPAVSQLVV
jgi:hypothetical protein